MEVFASIDLEVWRRAAGVGTCGSLPQELWRCAAGVALKEVWSSGALEACYTCRDVEEFASRALEIRCGRCLKRGMEIWSSGGTLQALPQKRFGALAYVLLLLEFLAFVPQSSSLRGDLPQLCQDRQVSSGTDSGA